MSEHTHDGQICHLGTRETNMLVDWILMILSVACFSLFHSNSTFRSETQPLRPKLWQHHGAFPTIQERSAGQLMLKCFRMSSGAIIFKLHFWEHAENLKHLHVQIAIKNERQGNEKARIYRKVVMRGSLCAGGPPLMNQWAFPKWLDWSPLASKAPVITCKLKLEALVWSPSYQTSILPHIKKKKMINLKNLFHSSTGPPPFSHLPSGREENHDEKPSIIPALDRRPICPQLKNDSINSLLLRRADCNWKFTSLVLSEPESRADHFLNLREKIRCFNCTHMAWIMPLWEKEFSWNYANNMCWCRCVCVYWCRCLCNLRTKLQCNQLNESELFIQPCGHRH